MFNIQKKVSRILDMKGNLLFKIEDKVKKKMDKKKVITEDLGKIFEKAICLEYEIDFNGKFKYEEKEAEKLKEKLVLLKENFPYELNHTAKNGNPYDFTSKDGLYKLSAKSTKKDGKVCPQVIGQPSKKKFCQYFQLDPLTDNEQIKSFIENNITILLEKYFQNTFDCSVIYYNQHKDLILFVNSIKKIEWTNYEISFNHNEKQKKWNESTTISINKKNIGEFQIHNHRDCIKFRWFFEKLLDTFPEYFDVKHLL